MKKYHIEYTQDCPGSTAPFRCFFDSTKKCLLKYMLDFMSSYMNSIYDHLSSNNAV